MIVARRCGETISKIIFICLQIILICLQIIIICLQIIIICLQIIFICLLIVAGASREFGTGVGTRQNLIREYCRVMPMKGVMPPRPAPMPAAMPMPHGLLFAAGGLFVMIVRWAWIVMLSRLGW